MIDSTQNESERSEATEGFQGGAAPLRPDLPGGHSPR